MLNHTLEEILYPKSIAIVGASATPGSRGYGYTHHLLDYGYQGKIYPVNPKYPEILGLKTYPSIKEIPGPVDFVISTVPASAVLNIFEDCYQKDVKGIHFFTGRFGETGRQEAVELEQEILKQAKEQGIRIIGPNCLGVYHPREGISLTYDLPKEPGSAGLAFQSGGGTISFINTASLRGVRFSKAISYGNAIDLNECDYLEYLTQDPETKLILMYVEGVRDGKRFFNALRQATSTKPVIIIKGGRGKSGARATASHTASLAGSQEVWEAAVTQAGAISAQNFDEMADLAVSFYFLPPIKGMRVGITGGGGGANVLAGDQCEEAGLDVIPLPAEIREELKSNNVPIWDWIGNPADMSITAGSGISGRNMLQMMAKNKNFDLLIINITEGAPSAKEEMISRLRDEVESYIKTKEEYSKPLLAVVEEKSLGTDDYDAWIQELSATRTKFLAVNTPLYPSIGRAARAVRKLIDYYQRRG